MLFRQLNDFPLEMEKKLQDLACVCFVGTEIQRMAVQRDTDMMRATVGGLQNSLSVK